MAMHSGRERPFFLNLLKIRQPIGAVVSIVHRVTGVLLVLLLVPGLYVLDLSLRSPADYARLAEAFGGMFGRLALIAIGWLFAQHLVSGIRLLLLDINIGIRLDLARASAWLTFAASVLALVLLGAAWL